MLALKVAEQIFNPIIDFTANLKDLKNEENRIEKLRSDGFCN